METVKNQRKPAWESQICCERRFLVTEYEVKITENEGAADTEPTATGKPAPKVRIVKEVGHVDEFFVDFDGPAGGRIRFRVNMLKNGRFTFSDPRERTTGTAGTTGIWGTRPAARLARPRSLAPTAFKLEAARLIGIERAEELLRAIMG